MKIQILSAIGLCAVLLAGGACRRAETWPPEPAPVHFGEEACAACSMIVSDPTYAAQIRDKQGGAALFDDIGCMLAKSKPATDPAGVFVRSADGTSWIRGDRAYVVRASSIASPMGYGFIAFASRSEAEEAARVRDHAPVVELRTLLGGSLPLPAAHAESDLDRLPAKGDVPE